MTDESNNVVDFTEFWLKKEVTKEEQEHNELDDLHDICTLVANDALNILNEEYDIDTESIEHSPEIIFFFEAFKGLIMKAAGHYHPFQDLALEFFEMNGITIEMKDDGNYHFVLNGIKEPEPENDG